MLEINYKTRYTCVCSLYHADVVASVTNSRHPFTRVLLDEPYNLRFLSGRAPTAHHSRTATRQLQQLQLIILQANLRNNNNVSQ